MILYFSVMRRIIATTLLTVLAGLLAAQGVNIRLDVSGCKAGTYKIIGMLGGQNFLADSVVSKLPGTMTWAKEKTVEPGLYYILMPDGNNYVQLLLDREQKFTMKTNLADLVGSMQVEGSEDNHLFYLNQRFEAAFKKRADSVDMALKALPAGDMNRPYLDNLKEKLASERKQHLELFKTTHPGSFFTVFKLSGQNPELKYPTLPNGSLDTLTQIRLYRDDYWKNTDLADARLLRTPVIPNKLKTYMTQLVPQAPDSVILYADKVIALAKPCAECYKYVVNWIAIQYEKPTIMGGEKVLVHMVDKYFTDEVAHWFKDKPEDLAKIRKKVKEMRVSLLGMTGQDLRCRGLDGTPKSLYELKGKAKIVYMYSTSCSHCIERTPVMVDVFEKKWKQYGLQVYALCLDPEEDKWKEFVAKNKMEGFVNVIDPKYESGYYKKYHSDITPELYILDENWKIVAKDLHPNQIDPVLKKLYGI